MWCRYRRWQREAEARQAEQAALGQRLRVLLAKQQAVERVEKQARAFLPRYAMTKWMPKYSGVALSVQIWLKDALALLQCRHRMQAACAAACRCAAGSAHEQARHVSQSHEPAQAAVREAHGFRARRCRRCRSMPSLPSRARDTATQHA